MTSRYRRRTLFSLAAAGLSAATLGWPVTRAASSGTAAPRIGLGTWLTFNVGDDLELLTARGALLRRFFELGGRLVDCAPMYGSSADTLGHALRSIAAPANLVAAEKVWRPSGGSTRAQIERQANRWALPRLNLVQVHNLSDWRRHLPALHALKESGVIDLIGVTTSHGRRHEELAQILESEPIDFVQLTYNATARMAEDRLLPLAHEQGVRVIANRPFAGGRLVRQLKRNAALPAWAQDEADAGSWPELLLKFVVSHPAVTHAIPATTRIAHLEENMRANQGPLPDAITRRRIAEAVRRL